GGRPIVRFIADRPEQAADLDVSEVRLVTEVGGEVRDVLDVAPEVVRGDIGKRLLDPRGPEQFVSQRDRHPRSGPALVYPPGRPLEIDHARPRRRVHEDGVLLADPEVAEVDKRVAKPEGVSAPTDSLVGAVEEVALDKRVDGPLVERRGRPRFESD